MCIASHVPARGHNPRQHDTARAFFARVVLSGNGKCRCDVHPKFGSFRCGRQSHVVLRIASGSSAVGAACRIAAASVLLSLWIASPSSGVLLYGCRRGAATRIHVHLIVVLSGVKASSIRPASQAPGGRALLREAAIQVGEVV